MDHCDKSFHSRDSLWLDEKLNRQQKLLTNLWTLVIFAQFSSIIFSYISVLRWHDHRQFVSHTIFLGSCHENCHIGFERKVKIDQLNVQRRNIIRLQLCRIVTCLYEINYIFKIHKNSNDNLHVYSNLIKSCIINIATVWIGTKTKENCNTW
jgi:hypothetical protein